jgi:type II secretory pathway pseudopilin PulG
MNAHEISFRLNRRRNRQHGYALLMVIFAMTLMLIAAMTAAPGIIANRKRQQEKEMIWRGNQYVRGIKMYYRKNGKFPTSLDDLMKPQVNNLHFMRQAYKDPMNKEDGTWRLIYVGPSGQLIGSLKPQPNPLNLPTGIPGASGIGTPAANMPGAGINTTNNPSGFGATAGQQGFGAQQGATGTAGTAGGTQTTGNGVSTDTDANGVPPLPETGTIFGGNIIGVGSKAAGRSVIWYKDAKNYRLFEFVWDPTQDTVGFGQQQNIPGGIPGTTQPGAQPGTQQSPFGNPGTTNPPTNPPPQNNSPQN